MVKIKISKKIIVYINIMPSICERLRQFFKEVKIQKSCVSSCCNTIIEKEHHHKKTHKHKDEQKPEAKPEAKEEQKLDEN
jgi:hypothetical protein